MHPPFKKNLHQLVTKPRVARYIYICNKQPTNPERTPDTTMENNVLTIFTRIRQRLHTTARSIAGEDNADDVLQDAFCKLWTLKNMPPDQQQTERIAAHNSEEREHRLSALSPPQRTARQRLRRHRRRKGAGHARTLRRREANSGDAAQRHAAARALDARLRGILVRRDCRRRRHDRGERKTDAFESAKTDS